LLATSATNALNLLKLAILSSYSIGTA
jgi:hypothetical protein